jgi:hypothetical protein
MSPHGAEDLQVDGMPVEMAHGLYVASETSDPLYKAPQIHEWPLGCELPINAVVQSCDQISDEQDTLVRGMVRVHLIGEGLKKDDLSDRDVYRIVLPLTGTEHAALWARRVDIAERGVIVSG